MHSQPLLASLNQRLHVWFSHTKRTDEKIASERYYQFLDHEERERYRGFRFPADRLTFLVAHVMLRMVLSLYVPCKPQQWRFVRGRYGKPEILPQPGLPPLRFSLSHTRGLVACVVALHRPCGIDVEYIQPLEGMRSIADSVFSDREIAYLNSQPSCESAEIFFSLWTLKEAYVKATGLGLSAELKDIAFDISASAETASVWVKGEVQNAGQWFFRRKVLSDAYQLAVAATPGAPIMAAIYHELQLGEVAITGWRQI